MHRTWLVLLVLCAVVLAGCSAPGGSQPTTDGTGDVTYPAGWGPEGPENATQAIHDADDLVVEEDFVERRIAVQEAPSGMDAAYVVDVLVVSVDRDQERLLVERSFYLASADLAGSIAESGMEPLADRRADEVRRTYLNASGGLQYHRLGNRAPRVGALDSGDYASATEQPLPAVLVTALPIFEGATYANPTPAGGGVSYSLSNVSAFHLEGASGPMTVGSDGLVTAFNVTEPGQDSEQAFRYDVEVGDLSLDAPEWSAGTGANRTPTE